MEKIKRLEIGILALLVILFPFLSTNFNTNLGLIYSVFTLSGIVYLILDPHRDIVFKKGNSSLLISVITALVAVVAFILLSNYIIVPGTKSILQLLSSSTPILANNVFTNKIVFGVLVAASETLLFFVYGFDLLASLVGVKISRENLKSGKLWAVIIGIALLFLAFHLTVKLAGGNIPDEGAILSTVFFMGIFSMLLSTWTGQAVETLLFHIILNSMAIGLIAFTVVNKLLGIG